MTAMPRFILPILVTLAIAGLSVAILPKPPALSAEARLHHTLHLTLEPASGELHAEDRIDVTGWEFLALKPVNGVVIDSITIDGEVFSAESDDGVTWITLPSTGEHQVAITYGGTVSAEATGRGLSPVVTADGVFLPYGIGWLANGGAEDDRVTYDLTLDVPTPYKAVATGDLISEEETDGRYRATFASSAATEPPSVFAGAYVIDEQDHNGLRLRTYFPEERRDLAATYLDQTAAYIDLFAEQIGDYPYNGFSVIASPLPVGLGFPGLTYVSSQILHLPFMQTRSLAHEILHNWWANGVFVDYSQGNWSEGLTTFMADYGLAEIGGEEAAWQMRLGWLRDFAALPAERDQPIESFRSKGHDADQVIGYNKTGMVFHMLKQELGEEAFDAALRAFWTEQRFKVASWQDLQASFENAADGRDLDGFFTPWLSQKGAPALSLDKADLRPVEGGFAVDLEISSDQPGYDLLVPVQLEMAEGLEQQTVRLQDGKANVTLELAEKPKAIGIDQQHDLFRRLADDEAPPILRDVTLSADTLTVVATNGQGSAEEVAEELASRTLDTGLRLLKGDHDAMDATPLMLVGLAGEMAPLLEKAGVTSVPTTLEGRGTARSWVAARDNAPPALVVEADDEAALSALLRPLPHYGRQSFLVFDGRKVIEQGVWPTGDNALTKRFD